MLIFVDYTAEKLEQAENQLAHTRFGPLIAPPQRKKEVIVAFSHLFLCCLTKHCSCFWVFCFHYALIMVMENFTNCYHVPESVVALLCKH